MKKFQKPFVFALGAGIVMFILQQAFLVFFGGSRPLDYDTSLDLNPSPPAKPGAWEEA